MANLVLFFLAKTFKIISEFNRLRYKTNAVIIRHYKKRMVIISVDTKASTLKDCQDILRASKGVFIGSTIRIIPNSVMSISQIAEALDGKKTSL